MMETIKPTRNNRVIPSRNKHQAPIVTKIGAALASNVELATVVK